MAMTINSFSSREITQRVSDWIKKYATNAGVESLIVGVSGGIDSALVSTLCAMTGMKTIVVSMPIDQHEDHLARANTHMEWLKSNYKNVSSYEIDLTNAFCKFLFPLEVEFDSTDKLAEANARSRMRMMTLYYVASVKNGIVVGTGNKVEDFGVGFFTKYGDGGVDISPIGDFTKTQVRELAKELNICQDIILAKPSDGLWEDDISDEDQIGATYEELEWAMKFMDSFHIFSSPDSLSLRQQEVLSIYMDRRKKNLHKMNPIPVFKTSENLVPYND